MIVWIRSVVGDIFSVAGITNGTTLATLSASGKIPHAIIFSKYTLIFLSPTGRKFQTLRKAKDSLVYDIYLFIIY